MSVLMTCPWTFKFLASISFQNYNMTTWKNTIFDIAFHSLPYLSTATNSQEYLTGTWQQLFSSVASNVKYPLSVFLNFHFCNSSNKNHPSSLASLKKKKTLPVDTVCTTRTLASVSEYHIYHQDILIHRTTSDTHHHPTTKCPPPWQQQQQGTGK